MLRQMSIRRREFWTACLVAAGIVIGGATCNELKDILDCWVKGDPSKKEFLTGSVVMFLIYLVLFAISAIGVYQLKVWRTLRNRMPANATPRPSPGLVLFLSKLPDKGPFVEGIPNGIAFTDPPSIDGDIALLTTAKERSEQPIRWPWEQLLRAIRLHVVAAASAKPLRHLIIICSKESCRQVAWFHRFLQRYQAKDLQGVTIYVLLKTENNGSRLADCSDGDEKTWEPLQRPQHQWNFEDFDELTRAMTEMFDLLSKMHLRDRDITVDFTGGQKVTSVVAAAVTFNREVQAQYVQTEYPYEVRGYDLDAAIHDVNP